MRILVSGSSGHIGKNLVNSLKEDDHEIHSIVRFKSLEDDTSIYLNHKDNEYDKSRFENYDIVIHLAGENILGRWTDRKKEKIESSRVESTRQLTEIFSELDNKPEHFICASAVGYYGDRGDQILNENSQSGEGFLPRVCELWEKAALESEKLGIRVVNLRTGMVLDPNEGALKQMILPFKFGLGGNLGSGNQYWSWISIDDEISAIKYIIDNEELSGPVNMVSPQPARNRQFTSLLSQILNRPAFMHVPEFLLNTVLGDMSEELFLSSTRAVPEKLVNAGFEFRHSDLEKTLTEMLS